jgi:hypothetical protein
MPIKARRPVEPTEQWQQLRLLVESGEQERYELLRPVRYTCACQVSTMGTSRRLLRAGDSTIARKEASWPSGDLPRPNGSFWRHGYLFRTRVSVTRV